MLCVDTLRLFLDPFSKHISSVLGPVDRALSPGPESRPSRQRRRNENINIICVLEGSGMGKIEGKLSKTLLFLADLMTLVATTRVIGVSMLNVIGVIGQPFAREFRQ